MKKILISLILVICLVLGISGCNSGSENIDSSTVPSGSSSVTSSESQQEEVEKVNNPLSVAQLELVPGTGGMSYVITLRNEGFIIIDGGQGNQFYSRHSNVLFKYLFDRTTKGEKPVILGWFFTHFHNDHVECAAEFLKEQADRLDVRAFYINSPGGDDYEDRQTAMEDLLESGMNAYPNAERHYLVTGEKIEFPHCTVDTLLTSSNLNSNEDTRPNNISAVFKMNFDTGKSFLVTGDTDHNRVLQLFDKSSSVYRPLEDLKCDIYQTPHHGRSLATAEEPLKLKTCYEQLNPQIVFIPISEKNLKADEFYNDSKWAENYYLINESGAEIYHHSQTATVNMEDLSTEID